MTPFTNISIIKLKKHKGGRKMNLKEAFRFQNKLQSLIDEVQRILEDESNITEVKTTHYRHRVNPDAEDETTLAPAESEFAEHITELVNFADYLLIEKGKLFYAIRKAKNDLDIDLDSEVSLNTTRQSLARTLKRMNDLRGSEQNIANGGTGYRFNADGNQVSYRCDIKRVTTINFDRKVIRKRLSEFNQEADKISAKIDQGLINSTVDYKAPFDVNDSFAEAFDIFTEKARA